MTGPIFTVEEKLTEYRALAAELSSLQWRTAAILFGATFLMIFWFSSALDLVLKVGAYTSYVRILAPFPIFLNAMCWLLWIFPEYLSMMRPWTREYRGQEQMGDGAILEKIDSVRYRLFRLGLTYRGLSICVALQFITMATVTAMVSFSFGLR